MYLGRALAYRNQCNDIQFRLGSSWMTIPELGSVLSELCLLLTGWPEAVLVCQDVTRGLLGAHPHALGKVMETTLMGRLDVDVRRSHG